MRFLKFIYIFLLAVVLFVPLFSFAGDLPVVYLYHGEECPHCKEEIKFLEELKNEFPKLEVVEYEVWHNEENRNLFLAKAEELGIKNLGVPLTVIGDRYMIGFDKPENSGKEIKEMLGLDESTSGGQKIFSLPIFGEINISNLSLPVLTIVLGTIDGFNPCSMWSLLVLLTLVIATGSRKKVWIVGSVFIITSAISYFVFMSAWLNAFIFLEYLAITRILIGIVAFVAGAIAIKEFITFKPNVCEVSSEEKKQKITEKLKNVINSPTLLLTIVGVIGVAFSVNLIELLCSLGIPVVFTKALTLHNLATWKYYTYIGFYDFFYMLDDIIVLIIAGFSMKFFIMNSNFSRYSRLVAGILMIALGAIFIFSPGLLNF